MQKDMPHPPAPGFIPPTAPPPYQETVHTQPNVVIVGMPQFGSESQRVTCPYCHADVSTSIETEANMKTHLFALLLCLVGCCFCAPCPYCMDSCMSKKHYCPSCKAFLGESNN